jgi:hypothetical protein
VTVVVTFVGRATFSETTLKPSRPGRAFVIFACTKRGPRERETLGGRRLPRAEVSRPDGSRRLRIVNLSPALAQVDRIVTVVTVFATATEWAVFCPGLVKESVKATGAVGELLPATSGATRIRAFADTLPSCHSAHPAPLGPAAAMATYGE